MNVYVPRMSSQLSSADYPPSTNRWRGRTAMCAIKGHEDRRSPYATRYRGCDTPICPLLIHFSPLVHTHDQSVVRSDEFSVHSQAIVAGPWDTMPTTKNGGRGDRSLFSRFLWATSSFSISRTLSFFVGFWSFLHVIRLLRLLHLRYPVSQQLSLIFMPLLLSVDHCAILNINGKQIQRRASWQK